MMAFKRKTIKWMSPLFLGIFILLGLMDARAQADNDISIVYTRKTTDQKNKLMEALPKRISKKAYNLGSLSIMDFSEKNKALLRMNASKMVIMLGDAPMKILKGAKINTDLLVIQSVRQTLHSSRWTLYILGQETALKTFDPALKKQKVSKTEDLGSEQDLRALTLLIVDTQNIPLQEVISQVVEKTLR